MLATLRPSCQGHPSRTQYTLLSFSEDQQTDANNQSYQALHSHENEYNEFDELDPDNSVQNESEQLERNYDGEENKYQIKSSSPYIPKPLVAKEPKEKSSETIFDSKFRVRKFSDAIRNELEQKFLENNFISGVQKSQLAAKLALTERQVQKWFVHRREKLRRHEKKYGVASPGQPAIKSQGLCTHLFRWVLTLSWA